MHFLLIFLLYYRDKIYKCLTTHIGTENNITAWYFIVSISEIVDFSSPIVFVDYFFENILNHQPVSN